MSPHHHPPAVVSEEGWKLLEKAFANSKYLSTVAKMRAVVNTPQRAEDVLPRGTSNYGHDPMNTMLNKAKLPFRFTRTETWTGEHRPHRKLAFVDWEIKDEDSQQLRFKF